MRKDQFDLPENVIYLDGNSLGPLAKNVCNRLKSVTQNEWGKLLIGGWNEAGWFNQPQHLGNRIAPLIGAPTDSVMVGDTLSIKVYQALSAALGLRPDRTMILTDNGNFPTDLYMAQGLIRSLDNNLELVIVDPEDVESHIDNTLAVLMLTHVDYRSGRLHDMAKLTEKAHQAGAVTVWDLAHSAGAVPLAVETCQAEFAVGCTYKYLNGGPGAPAFIYVRPDICNQVEPSLSGWHGHRAPFDFELEYRCAKGINKMRVGTPPVLQMAALDAALDVWNGLSMLAVRERSIELSELFISLVEASCPDLTLISPRDPQQRGSQVSFTFEEGYAVIKALIAKGVIGDFRAPNVMRFGITPLYLEEPEVRTAVKILSEIMTNRTWDQPKFRVKTTVT